jgi:hypothetical protein
MSSQGPKTVASRKWKDSLLNSANAGDYTQLVKSNILYKNLKRNPSKLSIDQRQSYNLQLDYNLGGVTCVGCTGGANYPLNRIG